MDILQSRADEFMARQGRSLCENGCEECCIQSLRGITGWDWQTCKSYMYNYIRRFERFVVETLHLTDPEPATQRVPYMPEGMQMHEKAIQVT